MSKIEEAKGIINCGLSYKRGGVAWTGGKDSTVILYIIKELFGHIPWDVFVNDTGDMFDEQKSFINNVSKLWKFKPVFIENPDKIAAINSYIEGFNPNFIMTGIRRDEHKARSKETPISKRKDHLRLHPVLNWSEREIWDCIRFNNIPFCSLYEQGYRSLGEKSETKPVESGGSERSGRWPTVEEAMAKLRKMGYY